MVRLEDIVYKFIKIYDSAKVEWTAGYCMDFVHNDNFMVGYSFKIYDIWGYETVNRLKYIDANPAGKMYQTMSKKELCDLLQRLGLYTNKSIDKWVKDLYNFYNISYEKSCSNAQKLRRIIRANE